MLGYMSESEAKGHGFTHHGKYFGIPVWIGDPYGDCMVATKVSWLEPVMSLAHVIEGLCHAMRGTEPNFMFLVGREIK